VGRPAGGVDQGVGLSGSGYEGGRGAGVRGRAGVGGTGRGEPGEIRETSDRGKRADDRPDASGGIVDRRPADVGDSGRPDQPPSAEQQRSGLEAGKSAAGNVGAGLEEAAKGLMDLFDPKDSHHR